MSKQKTSSCKFSGDNLKESANDCGLLFQIPPLFTAGKTWILWGLKLCLVLGLIACNAQPTPIPATATPAATATVSPKIDLPAESLFLEATWYQTHLVKTADLWNGGLDGQTGMGTYKANFDGLFTVDLDRQWRPSYGNITSIAQSRAIYLNIEAYRAAAPADQPRFLKAVNQGVDYLLTHFKDAQHGGFFWEVRPSGEVSDNMKQGYGNVHPLFVLAQAYSITKNPAHLEAALTQLALLKTKFLDPKYPGGIRPGFSVDFTEIKGVNNIDTFTHWFEALLALHDVTDGATQAEISQLIEVAGNFLVQHLYHDQTGFNDRGYVAYNYDEQWQPSQLPYHRQTQWLGAQHATPGHNIELAYLLSRAIERGFQHPEWLTVADKLINFCLLYAIDSPSGGMLYETIGYDGKPLEGNPDNDLFVWWAQAETARALLHFTVVRDKPYGANFKAIERLLHEKLTDHEYGGWVSYLRKATNGDLVPEDFAKGNVWKVNYHYSMLFAEVLRLQAVYGDKLATMK